MVLVWTFNPVFLRKKEKGDPVVETINVPAIIPAGLKEDLAKHSLVIRYESGDHIHRLVSIHDGWGFSCRSEIQGDPVIMLYGRFYGFRQCSRLDEVAEIIVRDPNSDDRHPVCRSLRTPTGKLLRCTE